MTPESSASQPIISTSQHSQTSVRTAGADPNASASVRSRSADGRQRAAAAATAATGISHRTAPTVRVPTFELALRSINPPPSPREQIAGERPDVGDLPAAGKK